MHSSVQLAPFSSPLHTMHGLLLEMQEMLESIPGEEELASWISCVWEQAENSSFFICCNSVFAKSIA